MNNHKMGEPEVVEAVKSYLLSLQDVDKIDDEIKFFENGLTCDVVGFQNNKINYIVECKGDIHPGGIAGGLGQAYQYAYQKSFNDLFNNDAKIIFACPVASEVFLNLMTIPKEIDEILLVDDKQKIRTYKRPSSNKREMMLHVAGATYLESMSIERIKHIINTLIKIENEEDKRNAFEREIKIKIPEIENIKNLLISPNSLGITREHSLTPKGYELYGHLKNSNEDFEKALFELLSPTLLVVLNAIIIFAKENKQTLDEVSFSQKDIEEQIIKIFGEKVNHFDYRRLGQPIKILTELNFLTKIRQGNYKVNKVTF